VKATIRRSTLAVVALVALVFGAAPTAGDIGSCGKTAVDIDEARFASARKTVDRRRCLECKIDTNRCKAAIDPDVPSDVSFGLLCRPLVRDAEVCLNALTTSSCGDYRKYMSDDERLIPGECDFCRGDIE
jgi:hypothetical protein